MPSLGCDKTMGRFFYREINGVAGFPMVAGFAGGEQQLCAKWMDGWLVVHPLVGTK